MSNGYCPQGRAEFLAVKPDGRQVFKRKHCENCKEERIFRGFECQHCKVMDKIRMPGGAVARLEEKKPIAFYVDRTRRRARAVMSDKKAFYARQAEESRKKFEGGK